MSRPHDASGSGEALPENPGRRRVLISAGFAAAAVALLPWQKMAYAQSPLQASPAELDGFLKLGQRLTSRKQLPADVSARLYAALMRDNADFGKQVSALSKALDQADIDDMRKFKGSAVESDAALKATVMTIVSGWYLGYTGTPQSLVVKDDTQFITYTDALMYQPTIDITVIPTYARAGTDYWAAPPPGVSKPNGA